MGLLGKRKRLGKLKSSKKARTLKPLREIIFESFEQELSEKITDALDKNPELRPGFDCCLICGAKAALSCPKCAGVKYCSDACMRSDVNHSSICDAISYIQEDAKIPVTSLVIDRYVTKSLKQDRIGSSMDEFLDGLGGLDPFSRTGRALSELLWGPLTVQKVIQDLNLGEESEVHIIQPLPEMIKQRDLWELANPDGELRLVEGAYDETLKKHKPDLVVLWQPGFGLNEENCKAFCALLSKEAPKARLLIAENSEMELLESGSLLATNKWMPMEDCQPNDFAPLCFRQSTSFANDIYRCGAFLAICALRKESSSSS